MKIVDAAYSAHGGLSADSEADSNLSDYERKDCFLWNNDSGEPASNLNIYRIYRSFLAKKLARNHENVICDTERWMEIDHKLRGQGQRGTYSAGDFRFFYSTQQSTFFLGQLPDPTSELGIIFSGLAKQWIDETSKFSLTYRRYAHGAYQAILTLGKDVVPYILIELRMRPDRWFEALKVLTQENPATNATTFEESVSCWLSWGKDKGLI